MGGRWRRCVYGGVAFGCFFWFTFCIGSVWIGLRASLGIVPSCLLRPALACRRPAASARALSRSISFSRCSNCLAVIAASAFAFLERPVKVPSSFSSSDSSSMVPFLERAGPDSETRRARFASCLALIDRQSSDISRLSTEWTHSSLLSSRLLFPPRLPASRALSSIARCICSASSSCSLLLIVPLRLPDMGSMLPLDISMRSFRAFSSDLLPRLSRRPLEVTGR